jgi:hypothetical protein
MKTRNQTAEHAVEAHVISDIKAIQVAAFCQKTHVGSVLGFPRPILKHYLERGITIKSVKKCDMLRKENESCFPHKKEEEGCHRALFCYTIMRAVIRQPTPSAPQLNWEVPEHPADSSDLAPSDFHVFGPLMNSLRGHRFADDELKERCVTGFAINHKTFIQMAL